MKKRSIRIILLFLCMIFFALTGCVLFAPQKNVSASAATDNNKYRLSFDYRMSDTTTGAIKSSGTSSYFGTGWKVNGQQAFAFFDVWTKSSAATSIVTSPQGLILQENSIYIQSTNFFNDEHSLKHIDGSGVAVASSSSYTNYYAGLPDGQYYIYYGGVRNSARNESFSATSQTFSIDTQAPEIRFGNRTYTGGTTFYRSSTTVEFYDEGAGIKTAKYAISADGEFRNESYTKNFGYDLPFAKTLSAEGNYTIYVQDNLGKTSIAYLTIDKTSPSLQFEGIADNKTEDLGYTNNNVKITWDTTVNGKWSPLTNSEDKLTVKYGYSTTGFITPNKVYTSGTVLSAEGNYQFSIQDKAGNKRIYKFTIDKTAPAIAIKTLNTKYPGANNVYGKSTIEYSYNADFEAPITATYSRSNITINEKGITVGEKIENDVLFDSGTVFETDGLYEIKLDDGAGNTSQRSIIIITAGNDYNRRQIETKGFYKTGNYKVKIPYLQTVIVPSYGKDNMLSTYAGTYVNANTYVFGSYAAALRFAYEIELATEVTISQTDAQGVATKWKYKQLNNANASMIYTDLEQLATVIEHYASKYVNEYGLTSIPSSVYTTSDIKVLDETVYKAETKNGNRLIGKTYPFAQYSVSLNVGATTITYTSLSSVSIVYKATGEVIYNGEYRTNMKFGELVGNYAGLFTITETDFVGNTYSYDVCLDVIAPTIEATYQYYQLYYDADGIRQSRVIEGQIELVNGLEIDANLKTFSVSDVMDDVDLYRFARIEDPAGNIFITDDFSSLTFGSEKNYTKSGEWRIKVYDRSLNVFEFAFTIAGETPRVSSYTKGVGDDKYVCIEFANGDAYSSITHFTIYRYGEELPEGTYEEKIDGETVNTMTIAQDIWTYTFKLGGIYTIRFTDSFNRVTLSEEIVFKKGLPEYTLTGVTEDGITNKMVTLSFANNVGDELSQDGAIKTGYGATTSEGYKIEIPATIENNGDWKVKLFLKSDTYTYINVAFKIDTVAPTATIRTEQGETLYWGEQTNQAFVIDWSVSDGVEKVKYSVGMIYNRSYSKGTLLTEDGIYTITVADSVGNTTTYQMELDTTLEYDIDYSGANISKDSTTFVRDSFTIIDDENLFLTVVKDGTQLPSPRFNNAFIDEGEYTVIIEDLVGNSIEFCVVIDKTAPTLNVQYGATEYDTVKVQLVLADVANYKITHNSVKKEIALSSTLEFSDWGAYSITVEDELGNSTTQTFTIAKTSPIVKAYDVDGNPLEENATTNKAIYFTWDDNAATGKVAMDGGISRTYKQATLLTEDGIYTLTITDAAKNKVTFSVEIVKTIQYEFLLANGEQLETLIVKGIEKTAQEFSIQTSAALSITATKDGETFAYSFGQQITVDGKYEFTIFDEIGNSETRIIVVDTVAPALTKVEGINETSPVSVHLDEKDAVIVEVIHTALEKKKTTLFVTEKYEFSDWGTYEVIARDALGNENVITFSIKRVAPTLSVQTVSGHWLDDGEISAEAILIVCSDSSVVKYKVNDGYNRIYTENVILSEQGTYTISTTDESGNYVETHVTIDSNIVFGIVVDGITIKDFSQTVIGKRYIELTPKEKLTVAYCWNNGTEEILTGSVIRVDSEGNHRFTLTDEVGNARVLDFVLDRTSPTVSIDTAALTKNDVVLSVDDLNDIYTYRVQKNGLSVSKYILKNTNLFTSEGTYTITVTDALGNRGVVEFTIKRAIDYKLSVANGFISRGKVTLELGEQGLNVVATHNNVPMELESLSVYEFTQNGAYSIIITDALGNEKVLTFIIEEREFRKDFEFTIPRDAEINVTFNGEKIEDLTPYITGDVLRFTQDGKYEIICRADGKSTSYEFTIDTVIPTLLINEREVKGGDVIEALRENFTLKSSKKNSTITVYFNGAEIEYNDGEEIDAPGEYKVVIKDEVGNVVEFEFVREFTFNTGAIVLFVMCGLAIVLIVVLIIRRRVKMRIS